MSEFKRRANKIYSMVELEMRRDLIGVAEETGYGTWCQDDFREELFTKGYHTGRVVADPICDENGNCIEIKVTAEVL